MVKLIKGKTQRALDDEALPFYLQDYLVEREMVAEIDKRLADKKATMMEYLEKEGAENQNGHKIIQVDGVATITRERRVKETLNEEAAIAWLEKQGLKDKVVKKVTIEEFDYDAFMETLFDKKVSQDTVDEMYDRTETFAFKITGVGK